jgi:hypothetical protein
MPSPSSRGRIATAAEVRAAMAVDSAMTQNDIDKLREALGLPDRGAESDGESESESESDSGSTGAPADDAAANDASGRDRPMDAAAAAAEAFHSGSDDDGIPRTIADIARLSNDNRARARRRNRSEAPAGDGGEKADKRARTEPAGAAGAPAGAGASVDEFLAEVGWIAGEDSAAPDGAAPNAFVDRRGREFVAHDYAAQKPFLAEAGEAVQAQTAVKKGNRKGGGGGNAHGNAPKSQVNPRSMQRSLSYGASSGRGRGRGGGGNKRG